MAYFYYRGRFAVLNANSLGGLGSVVAIIFDLECSGLLLTKDVLE